jgi:hypothetical protein
MATVLDDAEMIVFEGENAGVIVIQNHNGGHRWKLKSGDGNAANSIWVQNQAVASSHPQICKVNVEVFVLFEYIIVHDSNANFL